MDASSVRMTDVLACRKVSDDTSPSLRPPARLSFASCVDSIREGLRKLSGCRDVPESNVYLPSSSQPKRKTAVVTSPKLESLQIHDKNADYSRKLSGRESEGSKFKTLLPNIARSSDEKTSFDNFLEGIPKLDAIDRTVDWVFQQPDLESCDSLSVLPMRGTILPKCYTRENEPMPSSDSCYSTTISRYESARGTHGRGTPPDLIPTRPRLDELLQQLQQKQEQEAREQLISLGQQHLLSYNLLDVYSHQVPGFPLGTTPDIIPFLAKSGSSHNATRRPSQYNSLCPLRQLTIISPTYPCQWQDCNRMFLSTKDLLAHMEQAHITAYSSQGRLTCRWASCKRVFMARYKLLLHIRNAHCKNSLSSLTRERVSSVNERGRERERENTRVLVSCLSTFKVMLH